MYVMPFPLFLLCPSPAPTSAPATCPGSAPDPGLCICSTVQHHDDFPARAAQRAADQHQPAAEQHTARHNRGHLHAGPTDPVRRQKPNLILTELLLLSNQNPCLSLLRIVKTTLIHGRCNTFSFHPLQVPSRAAAGDQAGDSPNGMWCGHGAHLHVHGTGGHRIQPLWWATGKDTVI